MSWEHMLKAGKSRSLTVICSRTLTAWAVSSVTTHGIVAGDRSRRCSSAFNWWPDMSVNASFESRLMQPRRRLSASPVRTPER